jgi:hypothetical protein
MKITQMIDVQKCFDTIFKTLRTEDKNLIKLSSRLYNKNTDFKKEGINSLYEKYLHYVIFKALLSLGDYLVYTEDDYPNSKGKCDITLYNANDWNDTLWIEIKLVGYKEELLDGKVYREWIKRDAKKLLKLPRTNKFLLLIWVENGKPRKSKWKSALENALKGVKLDPFLFDSFKTIYYEKEESKKDKKGYCVVCLLRIL